MAICEICKSARATIILQPISHYINKLIGEEPTKCAVHDNRIFACGWCASDEINQHRGKMDMIPIKNSVNTKKSSTNPDALKHIQEIIKSL